MDDNYTLKIDPDTRDLCFDDEGIMETVAGDATSAQNVRLTLCAWKEEFPLVPSHGTDYARIMGKKPCELEDDEIPEVIREAVFQEPTVAEVDGVDYSLDGRALSVTFNGQLVNGDSITSEVSIE